MVAMALYEIVADTSTSAVVASEIVTVEYTGICSPLDAVPEIVAVSIAPAVTPVIIILASLTEFAPSRLEPKILNRLPT